MKGLDGGTREGRPSNAPWSVKAALAGLEEVFAAIVFFSDL